MFEAGSFPCKFMATSVPYVHLQPGNRRCNQGIESDCVTDFLELKNFEVGLCENSNISSLAVHTG